jgi:hypothetical protein
MKINLAEIDLDSFMVHPHQIAGETCWLIQPNHIGAKWNKKNLHWRSVVVNSAGEIISASYKKFFNWGEQPDLTYTPFSFKAGGGVDLLEKLDGSTLIVSKYKGQLIRRTRGTVDASKIDNGYELDHLQDKYPKAFDLVDRATFESVDTADYSLIFEWVSPVNRIVLNYGAEPDIYLTGMILHEDYSMVPQYHLDKIAERMGVKRPKRFAFDSIKDMLAAVEAFKGQEGICVYCNHGQDIRKVKSAWYLALHRMKSELGSFERLVDFYFEQGCPDYEAMYQLIVNHFDYELAETYRGDVSRIASAMKEVNQLIAKMQEKVNGLKTVSRKDAAAVILQAYGDTNRAGMAFKLLDNKPLAKDDLKKLLYQITKD